MKIHMHTHTHTTFLTTRHKPTRLRTITIVFQNQQQQEAAAASKETEDESYDEVKGIIRGRAFDGTTRMEYLFIAGLGIEPTMVAKSTPWTSMAAPHSSSSQDSTWSPAWSCWRRLAWIWTTATGAAASWCYTWRRGTWGPVWQRFS